MRNPLILTALLYVAGIVLGSLCPGPLLWLFIASSAVALIALLFSSARKGALLLLLPLVGWANLTCRMAVISPDDLRILIGSSPVYLHLRGRLCGAPVYRETERNHRLTGHSMAEVDVEAARIREDWQRAFGRVAVSTPGPLGPQFFAGRKVEIVGVLQSPKGPAAPGQFDYRAYLRYRGVFYQLRVGSSNDWTWAEKAVGLNAPAPPWTDRFNTWARAALARGLFGEDESLRLLWAMVLGWQTALTQEVAEPFMQSGTLHIFAKMCTKEHRPLRPHEHPDFIGFRAFCTFFLQLMIFALFGRFGSGESRPSPLSGIDMLAAETVWIAVDAS